MILRLDGIKYDIYEGKDWIAGFKNETKLGSKCFSNFVSKSNIGYADVLYYELTVLSGLKHSIQDYKYKDKIYIAVVETYKDSNGKKYTVQKKINVGAYIQYKNTKFTMAHLTQGNAGQLISVAGVVFNNSDFTITIKDLKLYKSMSYSNANVKDDDHELENETQAGEHIDEVGGERTEPFEVWASTAGYVSRTPVFEYFFKEGNTEGWSTLDFWKLGLKKVSFNGYGYETDLFTNEVYTDKNQLCSMNEDTSFNIPAYTEYLYIQSTDSDGYEHTHVIYLNSLDFKYIGTDEKYHRSIIDGSKTARVYYTDIIGTKYKHIDYFVSNVVHNEIGEMPDGFPQFEGTFNKYEDENFDGACTLQIKVIPENEDEEIEIKNIFFSTQPFKLMTRLDGSDNGDLLASSVPVYLGDKAGEEYLFWVIPRYYDYVAGFRCEKSISKSVLSSTSVVDIAKKYFANDMRALDKFEIAIEDR